MSFVQVLHSFLVMKASAGMMLSRGYFQSLARTKLAFYSNGARLRCFSASSHVATTQGLNGSQVTSSLPPVPENAHRIVFMRHGQSSFNDANIFTGWCDVALTPRGIVEAEEAGEVFRSHNLTFSHCYTSLLTRSIVTAQRSLEAAGISYVPISYDWRLNERHYGALQGLSKERTGDRLGRERVMKWRRSYHARPPAMTEGKVTNPLFPLPYMPPVYLVLSDIRHQFLY